MEGPKVELAAQSRSFSKHSALPRRSSATDECAGLPHFRSVSVQAIGANRHDVAGCSTRWQKRIRVPNGSITPVSIIPQGIVSRPGFRYGYSFELISR